MIFQCKPELSCTDENERKKERIGSSRFELESDPNLTPIRIKCRHLSTSYYPHGVDSDLASKTQIFGPLNFEL